MRKFFPLVFISFVFSPLLLSQIPADSITILNFADTLYFNSIESQGVDVSKTSGTVSLKTSERENLAKGRRATLTYYGTGAPRTPTGDIDTNYANPLKAIDGNNSTFFQIKPGGEGSYILIDLQAMRRINKVVIRTFGRNSALRPRAYTIYAGTDSLQLVRVAQRSDNTETETVDIFDPIIARFVKVTFDVIDRFSSTVISEIEVYGLGYLSSGFYISKVIDVGRGVNWGYALWDAELPEGTDVNFQFRTGSEKDVNSSWSEWSAPVKMGELLRVSEPRRFIQFRANLSTSTTETPILKDLRIFYHRNLVAQSVKAEVQPSVVPILKRTEISYIFDATFDNASLGIDTVVIFTPSPSNIVSVTVNGSPVNYASIVSADFVKIAFSQPVRNNSQIAVKLSLTLYLDVNEFPSYVISKMTWWNPQFVDYTIKGGVKSWTVFTTDVPERLITDLKIEPNPFSPNGDGLNDEVRISFFLANLIAERNLKIQVFDLTGRLVRTIFDGESKAFAYIAGNSFYWDGRDGSGRTVPPGVYLLRVSIKSDNGGETIYRTVTVVY